MPIKMQIKLKFIKAPFKSSLEQEVLFSVVATCLFSEISSVLVAMELVLAPLGFPSFVFVFH